MGKNDNQEINPYISGRREWNERYGDYIKQASTWRLIAIIASAIAAISVLGVIYIGAQSKITPYVVQVDKLGRSVTSGPAEGISVNDERVITAALADCVSNFRTIWSDAKTQEKMIFEVYKYLKPGSAAEVKVNDSFRKESPFSLIGSVERSIQIKDVIKVQENTWQVDWTEETRTKDGANSENSNYKAVINIAQTPPQSIEEVYKNPLGIYITSFNYSKII